MWKRRLIGDDRHVRKRISNDRQVSRNGERKVCTRMRCFGDADLVDPHDIFIGVRHLGAVMVEVSALGAAAIMSRHVAVCDRRVMVVGIRPMDVFWRKHRRYGQPGRQRNDGQNSRHRTHSRSIIWVGTLRWSNLTKNSGTLHSGDVLNVPFCLATSISVG